jgi:hypothetical protein
MTTFEKIKAEAKARYIVGFLIGTLLAIVLLLCFFVIVPKENEVIFSEIRTAFTMAFGAFIQHIMKTPEKEKNTNNV